MQFGCAGKLLFVINLFFAGASNVAYCQDGDPYIKEFEQARQKLLHEATKLFSVKFHDKINLFHRCEISNEWNSYTIDEGIAKRQLDLHVHASLSAPDHGANLPDIIDPKKIFKNVFCNEDEVRLNKQNRLIAFKKQPSLREADKFLNIELRSYSFPIFNNDYTKALLVYRHTGWHWSKLARAGTWNYTVVTELYSKRNGTWEYIKNLDENNADGGMEGLE